MHVLSALLTIGFSLVVAVPALASGNDLSVAAGAFGFLAGMVLLLSARVGFYALLGIAIMLGVSAVQGAVNGDDRLIAALPLAVAYGLFAFLAYRTWQGQRHRREERRLAAERAERADRYLRQQLGE